MLARIDPDDAPTPGRQPSPNLLRIGSGDRSSEAETVLALCVGGTRCAGLDRCKTIERSRAHPVNGICKRVKAWTIRKRTSRWRFFSAAAARPIDACLSATA